MTDSTTTRGNAFRDHVAELLKLAGWVGDSERLIGGKKADLLMARSVYGRPWRLAVETKNYDSSLGMGELEKIIGGYFAAVQNHEINQLWIVSNHPLKGGKEFIDSIQWARHFTIEELLRNQMDFSSYLATLKFEHESSGLENYYISPQARLHSLQDSIFDLGEYLASWLNGTNCSPIAIVEGYGTGKTSVARHLAYALASEFSKTGVGRIPIYIELGRFTSQQKITGLLGTMFTNDYRVENFSYPLFRRLNQMGCFAVILDGFDEMKHLMTRSDFEYNFKQLHELVEGDSRVILLGRPSAFSSEEERQYLLHGARPRDGEILYDRSKPNYVEVRLQRFDKTQVAEFVRRFLTYKATAVAPGAVPLTGDVIERRLREISENDYGDLLERPVQARMLAEIATKHTRPLGELTRFSLYELFMEDLIEREMEKDARREFPPGKWRKSYRFVSEVSVAENFVLVVGGETGSEIVVNAESNELLSKFEVGAIKGTAGIEFTGNVAIQIVGGAGPYGMTLVGIRAPWWKKNQPSVEVTRGMEGGVTDEILPDPWDPNQFLKEVSA